MKYSFKVYDEFLRELFSAVLLRACITNDWARFELADGSCFYAPEKPVSFSSEAGKTVIHFSVLSIVIRPL